MRNTLIISVLACACLACTLEIDDTQPAETQPAAALTQPDTDSAEAWLERIEKNTDSTRSLSASLRYDRNQLLLGDKQRRFGTLVYQAGPPARFEIHFDKLLVDDHWTQPDLKYISDGRWLLKRDEENKTAVRYQLVADGETAADAMTLGDGPFPVPLNLKKEKVLSRFNVALFPPAEDDPDNSIHLRLTPREDNETDLVHIDLWFDRDTLTPTRVLSLDDSENQTEVRLSDTQINPDLQDQTFDTALPTEPGWQTDENRISEE
jgi:hypothetical protein